MKRHTLLLVALCALSCADDRPDNLVDFTFRGESLSWASNDGSCQMRNQSSALGCSVDVGQHPDEVDLSFSVRVDVSDVIEEGVYEDERATAYPDVEIGLWIEGGDGEPQRFETPTANDDPLTLTIARMETSSVRGSFEGVLECAATGESEAITASYYMTITE